MKPVYEDGLGGLGGPEERGWGLGVSLTAECDCNVISVSPGGKFRVVVTMWFGNWREVVNWRSAKVSKVVTVRMIVSLLISSPNLWESVIH